MSIVLGIDLGTTTITALALDAQSGRTIARCTTPNTAEITSPSDKVRGYSEWGVRTIAGQACTCLHSVAEQVRERRTELAGIGITGQQHGVVVVDEALTPLTPFVNWQDRRGEDLYPGTQRTYVRRALDLVGEDAPQRTGCRLAAGYMAVTLFWMKANGVLPRTGTACFVMDYFGALLTGRPLVTDATCGASSGVLNVRTREWDPELLAALSLPQSLLPEVRPSGEYLGPLASPAAETTGLPAGLPVFVGIGDNQASFLGSVARRDEMVLVNVGTGGQVTAYTGQFLYDPLLETRPFLREGHLLVCAGLCGGHAYALLERFYREVGAQILGVQAGEALYQAMNRLAANVPRGAGGLRCEPFFTGTRARPELRASWSGVSAENFTPAHMTRALLEGMARAFHTGYELIARNTNATRSQIIGAGNGLRENPVLAKLVAEEFGLPLIFPAHREEAAYGAALLAAVGAGVCPDLASAGQMIRYE
jgi:sugar (pentulose or hexulose) kinase